MKIVAKDATEAIVGPVVASFRDTMMAQAVKFDWRTDCSQIELFLVDYTRGSTWDDICISNLEFFHGATKLTPFIEPDFGFVSLSVSVQYTYDKGVLVQKHSDLGLNGTDEEFFAYNPTGAVSFSLDRQTNQGLGTKLASVDERYTCYFYEDQTKPKQLTKWVSLDGNGEIIQTAEYQYDLRDRVLSVTMTGKQNGTISYAYEDDNLVGQDTHLDAPGGISREKRVTYYHSVGLATGERVEYGTGAVSLVQYLYSGSQIVAKVDLHGTTGSPEMLESISYKSGAVEQEEFYIHRVQ